MGAVAGGLLLGAASKPFGLEFADLTAELFVLLLHGRQAAQGIGVSALPIAGLLSPLQVLASELGHVGAQLIHVGQEADKQGSGTRLGGEGVYWVEQRAIHDSGVVRAECPEGKRVGSRDQNRGTGSAVLYKRPH